MARTRKGESLSRLSSQNGTSLIEVLAAITLFTVVAGGLTVAVVANTRINHTARTSAAAAALVQNKIEQFRGIVTTTGVIPPALTVGTHSDGTITAEDGAGGRFTRSWTVTSVRPGLVKIEVKVSWTKPTAGSTKAITYACTQPRCTT